MEDRVPDVSSTAQPLSQPSARRHFEGRGAWVLTAYGISGLFSNPGNSGVHGRNEQVSVKAVYESKEFLYRLVKRLAGG